MSQKNGLDELAALAKTLTPARRKELNGRLPFDGSPRENLGVVRGLVAAANAVEATAPQAARELRELAAVGAARALQERRSFAEILKVCDSPETRAQLEAEDELISADKMEMLPLDEVIRELEQQLRNRQPTRSEGA